MKQGEELENRGDRMTGRESVKNKYLLNERLNLALLQMLLFSLCPKSLCLLLGFNCSECYCHWEIRYFLFFFFKESAAWKIPRSNILEECHIWYGHWTRLTSSLFMISGAFPLRPLRIASDPVRSQKRWNQIFLRSPHRRPVCLCKLFPPSLSNWMVRAEPRTDFKCGSLHINIFDLHTILLVNYIWSQSIEVVCALRETTFEPFALH